MTEQNSPKLATRSVLWDLFLAFPDRSLCSFFIDASMGSEQSHHDALQKGDLAALSHDKSLLEHVNRKFKVPDDLFIFSQRAFLRRRFTFLRTMSARFATVLPRTERLR